MNRRGLWLAIAAVLLVTPSMYLVGELTGAPQPGPPRGAAARAAGAAGAAADPSSAARGASAGSDAAAEAAWRDAADPLDVASAGARASRGVYAFSYDGSKGASGSGALRDASYRNRDASFGSPGQSFDPRDLAVLDDIIRLNGLTEASSSFDYDDGDGVLEATELGTQIWCGSRLRALLMGPSSASTFGYTLRALPETISNLDYLVVLEANATGLEKLPAQLGQMADLERLSAFDNRLTEIPPELAQAERLAEIDLDANQISSVPKELQEKRGLKGLFVEGNPIAQMPSMVRRQYEKLMQRKLVLGPRELGAFGADCRVL